MAFRRDFAFTASPPIAGSWSAPLTAGRSAGARCARSTERNLRARFCAGRSSRINQREHQTRTSTELQHILHNLHFLPLAWWLIVAALGCCFVANYLWWLGPVRQTDYCPNVLLIIPVRGVPKTLSALWRSLC